ncbi:hypothetical protein C2845_PM07G03500 [Panicum miliaceum]|uniref:Uncharacterized protein n=1 Tax=Panicum miliaceum TaxID=4540 RepID=A0A3L6SS42_PANMI|nr:hypothetical protein C2845_PM07G03500 [Panicum miliaceum]
MELWRGSGRARGLRPRLLKAAEGKERAGAKLGEGRHGGAVDGAGVQRRAMKAVSRRGQQESGAAWLLCDRASEIVAWVKGDRARRDWRAATAAALPDGGLGHWFGRTRVAEVRRPCGTRRLGKLAVGSSTVAGGKAGHWLGAARVAGIAGQVAVELCSLSSMKQGMGGG